MTRRGGGGSVVEPPADALVDTREMRFRVAAFTGAEELVAARVANNCIISLSQAGPRTGSSSPTRIAPSSPATSSGT